MPTFDTLDSALRDASAELEAAEAHGILSGLACFGGTSGVAILQGEVFGERASDTDLGECPGLLSQLWQNTCGALHSDEYTFEPMLPDDDVRLDHRTRAFGEWCAGFLAGLGLGGVRQMNAEFSDESTEFLHDLNEMSRIEPDLTFDEESEAAYAELVEYVRVGVMLLSEEVQRGVAKSDTDTLH